MPSARTQTEYEQQERRHKLANSYQSLLSEFSSSDLRNVGNYALGRLIGKGSFGKVYLAQHKLTNGSKVVLKSAHKSDPNLAREIHHHRQFLHPHIARLYEVIVTESLVWLVLEWCPGDELYNHLLQHGRMEPAKVQKIFTQLVGAVSYVHGKSCVHRDLKLENILLDKHENVKLVDFGFTREYSGTTSYLQTWCGTVCYSAPEMLRGEKYAGEKVDVWSLGIILYALLCGELPYDEDDDTATKKKILNEDPTFPDHFPDAARDLVKRLLSKRPLLRPTLADLLKDPWLAEHAPHQQEILKIQQPTPFSTQLEKDTLERMRSAGVNIDTVIEHVLAQRCDSLAGWWALLIEKEQRKERRRERKRRERDSEGRSSRRLSTASGKLFASLGEIQEGSAVGGAPISRGRSIGRVNGGVAEAPLLPKVAEAKSPAPDQDRFVPSPPPLPRTPKAERSPARPPLPPKDYSTNSIRRPRNASRGSASLLRVVATNPDLLGPQYVAPAPQRKRRTLMQHPLREQLAWVKHWFKESAYSRRGKSPNNATATKGTSQTPQIIMNGGAGAERSDPRVGKIAARGAAPLPLLPPPSTDPAVAAAAAQMNFEKQAARTAPAKAAMPVRPRVDTSSTMDNSSTNRRKRQSLSPGTLTPHSSVRRPSAGLHGRKSTSSSISSIRSTYQSHHQHSHSKASSTSSASIASPSGLSSTSGSRLARSPHSSVKVLPSTPTSTTLPSGIRVSRRPPPSTLGPLPPPFIDPRLGFASVAPGSPSVPVFARRKRSVFKGPGMTGSPATFGRVVLGGSGGGAAANSRSASVPRRTSSEIPNITEEDEEEPEEVDEEIDGMMMLEGDEDDDDVVIEEVDRFGAELQAALPPHHTGTGSEIDTLGEPFHEPVTPLTQRDDPLDTPKGDMTPGTKEAVDVSGATGSQSSTPLTAQALARMQEQQELTQATAADADVDADALGPAHAPAPVTGT